MTNYNSINSLMGIIKKTIIFKIKHDELIQEGRVMNVVEGNDCSIYLKIGDKWHDEMEIEILAEVENV
jgi:hypothetical protein